MGILDRFRSRTEAVVTVEPDKAWKIITKKCRYEPNSGVLIWAEETVNPGDFVRIKHTMSDEYNTWTADEAGIYLGVQDSEYIVFQVGVKKQTAEIKEVKSLKVMSRMDDSIE